MYRHCATDASGENREGISRDQGAHVTHERVESPKGRPSCTKILSSVTSKAADICPNHRHLVHASEAKDTGDGVPVMFPQTEVVSQPLADVLACTSKCRTSNNERSQSGSAGEERVPGRRRHQGSVQVIWIDMSLEI